MPATPALLPDFAAPDTLLGAVLAVSLTAIQVWRPCCEPDSPAPTDFALEYLNPAAQRVLGSVGHDSPLLLSRHPEARTNGVFAFYCRVFTTSEPGQHTVHYQNEGQDQYFNLAARRSGPQLVVSFNDTADQDRTLAATTQREREARDLALRALAEEKQAELRRVFEQAPMAIAILRGPELVVEVANANILEMWGKTPAEAYGQPLFGFAPEARGQGYEALFEQVLQTGTAVVAQEHPVTLRRYDRLETPSFNFIYQALRDAHGHINGVMVVATEVTQLVRTRQQVQALNQKLAASNAELRAHNAELEHAQKQLQHLNQTLDARVNERTGELEMARADADRHRAEVERVFEQAPVAIAVLQGPRYVVEMANPGMCALWGRTAGQVVGKPMFEALPEAAGQGFEELLDAVLATGVPNVAKELPFTLVRAGQLDTVYCNFVYQPLLDAQGDISGVTVVATDVSEQVQAREQTQQLNQELEARVTDRTLALAQAHADTERARQRLDSFFQQAPVAICVHRGPELAYELANPAYEAFFPDRSLLGQPLLAVLPEVAGLPAWHIPQRVYATGVSHSERAMRVPLARPETGALEDRYFDLIYQARPDEAGHPDAVIVFCVEVTSQVRDRQRADALHAEVLASARHLTLERAKFHQVFKQTPAAICLLRGPEHRFAYINPAYQRLAGGRAVLGQPLAQILPEAKVQEVTALLNRVYQTGETFFGHELPLSIGAFPGAVPENYFTFTNQAMTEDGQIVGILVFAYDVTAQVVARLKRAA